jgi:hypothetical protein
MRRVFFPTIVIALLLFGCGEDLEQADFNAYFYYPEGREEFLGLVRGLSACQVAASSRAASLHITKGWSYICCKQTSSSSCASKHK